MLRHISLKSISWLSALLLGFASSSVSATNDRPWLAVDVTAYNAAVSQTDGNPWIAAWGDRLRPGMRAIAVSRDLLSLGIGHRARIEIDGLAGEYVVLDKTHRRWTRRVDLFMGEDVRKAQRWGKREMRIRCIGSCAPLAETVRIARTASETPGARGSLRRPGFVR